MHLHCRQNIIRITMESRIHVPLSPNIRDLYHSNVVLLVFSQNLETESEDSRARCGIIL